MKKKYLIILGIILVSSCVGFFVYISSIGKKLDYESKIWVDNTIPQIVSSWDIQKLLDNSSTEFLQNSSQAELQESYMQLSSDLGVLNDYKGSEGEAGIKIMNGKKVITAEYVAEGVFERGVARIYIKGIKENNEWKIFGLHVQVGSPL